jgi:hypothetical protein
MDTSDRPAKRRCVICKVDTRWECSNAGYMDAKGSYGKSVFQGTPICPVSVGARKNLVEFGGLKNNLTCLQIHQKKEQAKPQAFLRQHHGVG